MEEYVVPGTGYLSKNEEAAEVVQESHNDFTPMEKATMALQMAESLAVLHGHGIVHNDVQLSQWLRIRKRDSSSSDNNNDQLVLGDFNSARILEWNVKDNTYCKYSTGTVFGNVSLYTTYYYIRIMRAKRLLP